MSVQLVMPKSGLTMIEGTISAWMVEEGVQVKQGQPVMEFENEKTTMECEASEDGFLHIVASSGNVVKVGEVIAVIGKTQEEYLSLAQETTKEVLTEVAKTIMEEKQTTIKKQGHIKATGLARNIGKKEGIDLSQVVGTGPNGRVVSKDVYQYMESRVIPILQVVDNQKQAIKIPLTGKRKSIAKNMRKSFETMAQLTVFAEVDVTDLIVLRKKYVENMDMVGCKITLNDLLMLATIKMLGKHPLLNSTFDGEVITTYPYVNLGMAVGLADGLIVPVLKNADNMSLTQLSSGLRGLATRAKEDDLISGEQTEATFTVTNVGMFHIDFGTPIISPPQVGIIGFGSTKKKFVEYKGEFCPRDMMHVMLTFDHRVFDGREAGEVLGDMKKFIENPELIFV